MIRKGTTSVLSLITYSVHFLFCRVSTMTTVGSASCALQSLQVWYVGCYYWLGRAGRARAIHIWYKRDLLTSTTNSKGSEFHITLVRPTFQVERTSRNEQMVYVYSLGRTNCPAHILSNQTIVDARCQNILYKSDYGCTNIVVELAIQYYTLIRQLTVFDGGHPNSKYAYLVEYK